MRTLIKILIFAIVLVVIATAVYLIFFNPQNFTPQTEAPIESGGLPIAEDRVFEPTTSTSGAFAPLAGNYQSLNDLTNSLGANDFSIHSLVGAVFAPTASSTSEPAIIFLSKNQPGIYSQSLSSRTATKIGDLDSSRVNNAIWASDPRGLRLFAEYFDNADQSLKLLSGLVTFSSGAATEAEFTESAPPATIGSFRNLTISPNQKQIFYFEKTTTETRGVITDPEFKVKTIVFSSPFHSWRATWPQNETVVLNTKASGGAPGAIYLLDLKKRQTTKLLGDRKGLVGVISPGLTVLAYSETLNNLPRLTFWDIKGVKNTGPTINTLAEKCVWQNEETIFCAVPKTLPQGEYPDVWYMGEINTNDDLWKINILAGETRKIRISGGLDEVFDAENLFLSKDSNTLFLTNRLTSRLMAFDLKESL